MTWFKRKVAPLSARIAAELEYTELQLLEAEGKLENAIGERDTLSRRRERLYAALGSQLIEEGQPKGYLPGCEPEVIDRKDNP